jgi:hypothetical protein
MASRFVLARKQSTFVSQWLKHLILYDECDKD